MEAAALGLSVEGLGFTAFAVQSQGCNTITRKRKRKHMGSSLNLRPFLGYGTLIKRALKGTLI